MGQPLPHDYFYGNEAEQYMFIRFPKALISNNAYKSLSDGSKILYGLMLDRMGLSIKNGWLDDVGRSYIYFTLETIQEQMNCGHNKGVKMMAELENIGLIERKKQGWDGPPSFTSRSFCLTVEPKTPAPMTIIRRNIHREIKTSEKRNARLPIMGSQDFPIKVVQTSAYRKQIRLRLAILILTRIIIVILTILSNLIPRSIARQPRPKSRMGWEWMR